MIKNIENIIFFSFTECIANDGEIRLVDNNFQVIFFEALCLLDMDLKK